MRIAYVYDALYPHVTGGAERRYFELGERLAARGHDVHFVSWRYPESDGTHHPAIRLHGVGAAPALHDASGRRSLAEAANFAARCVPVLARLDVDVIDCSSIPYLSALIAAMLRGRSRARLMVTWHEYMGARWRTYLRRGAAAARLVERAAARVGDGRLAVSEFTARRLPPGPPICVIENGVDLAAIRRAMPLRDAPDIVAAGRLVPHKRIELLLESLAVAPGVTAAIIGDGPERVRLQQRAVDLRIADRVRFLGWLGDARTVYTYFAGAAGVVVLSEQEGFGLTVIEAQAAGAVPIVARSQFSAATELVEDGMTGLTVGANVDQVSAAIRRVTRDDDLRRALRDGATRAAARYDWDAIAERIERVYDGRVSNGLPELVRSAA